MSRSTSRTISSTVSSPPMNRTYASGARECDFPLMPTPSTPHRPPYMSRSTLDAPGIIGTMVRTGVLVAAALALAACGGESSPAATTPDTTTSTSSTVPATTTTVEERFTIAGSFTLTDSDVGGGTALTCYGTGGFDDFGAGMNVTVRDGAGVIVGSGSTRDLTFDDFDDVRFEDETDYLNEYPGITCMKRFDVEVKRAEFYEIEIGRRGALSYSFEDLESNGWVLSLTL